MLKIVTVVGARPQFIKAAALSRILRETQGVQEILVHTGQHFDTNMSDVFFTEMDIPHPDYNLDIANLSHGAMTGRMLEALEKIILKEYPDLVLVYGDTNSTLAAALAAAKLHIPIAHVEAGLRSFNRMMPEELNRVLTDHSSDILFCPTKTAVTNLYNEGITKGVRLVGDVMYDAAMFYSHRAKAPSLPATCFSLEKPFALATLHRAENTDDVEQLRNIFSAFAEISNELPILLPIHPRTRQKLLDAGINIVETFIKPERLCIVEPVGYLEMIYLLQQCQIVLTDSGGLQKEAFFFRKPCVTLRDETEWVELVEHDVNMLAGSDKVKIIDAVEVMKNVVVSNNGGMYGSGQAAIKIVESLMASSV